MSRIIKGHLINMWEWREWVDYVEYGESEWSKKQDWYNAYQDTPSKEECDRICEERSSEVKVYSIKQ